MDGAKAEALAKRKETIAARNMVNLLNTCKLILGNASTSACTQRSDGGVVLNNERFVAVTQVRTSLFWIATELRFNRHGIWSLEWKMTFGITDGFFLHMLVLEKDLVELGQTC